MARSWQDLKAILKELLPENDQNIYFQEPSAEKLVYPCIIFHRDFTKTTYANNLPYRHTKRYQVTVIQRSPEPTVSDKVAELPLSAFNRFFVADGLNHFVHTIYF